MIWYNNDNSLFIPFLGDDKVVKTKNTNPDFS